MIINKKNILLAVLLSVNCFLCVYGMEKKRISSYKTIRGHKYDSSDSDEEYTKWLTCEIVKLKSLIKKANEERLPKKMEQLKLKDMAFVVKEKIIEAQKERDVAMQNCKKNSLDNFEIIPMAYKLYRRRLAVIALNNEHLMSKQNRLQCLSGTNYYHQRKRIILSMIENDGINPNEICWGFDFHEDIHYRNPFNDSINYDDISFTGYLFVHGARPTFKDLCIDEKNLMYKKVCSNDTLKNLFLKYKIMFYTRNNFGHIIPDWKNIPVKDLAEYLLNLINIFKAKKDEVLFSIDVIYNEITDHNIINTIQKAGFKTSYADCKGVRLVYEIKNTPCIPLSQGSNTTCELISIS